MSNIVLETDAAFMPRGRHPQCAWQGPPIWRNDLARQRCGGHAFVATAGLRLQGIALGYAVCSDKFPYARWQLFEQPGKWMQGASYAAEPV